MNAASRRIRGGPETERRPAARQASWGEGILRAVLRLVLFVGLWSQRIRQRRALSVLDDTMLRDIGLTRSDVEREIGKPFWRH